MGMFGKAYKDYAAVREFVKEAPKMNYPAGPATRNTGAISHTLNDLVNGLNRKELRIIDYAGANGAHYSPLKKEFPDIKYDYSIVELEALKDIKLDNVKFYTTLSEIDKSKGVDIFHSNAGIQYVKDIEIFFNEVLEFDPEFIAFERVSIADSSSIYYTTQNYMGRDLAYLILTNDYVLNFFESRGYELMEKLPLAKQKTYKGDFGVFFGYMNYVFERK